MKMYGKASWMCRAAGHCFALSEKRYVCWAYGLRFALAFAGVGALASLLEESPHGLRP